MEQLRKDLQEKGYTFFRMQDYPEFTEQYTKYKKYICNSEKNLLQHMNSVRLDGMSFVDSDRYKVGERIQIQDSCNSFEEANEVSSKYLPDGDSSFFSQYWFFGEHNDIKEDFKKLIDVIVEKIYDVKPILTRHLTQMTYYKKGCFLKEHRDGKVQNRICAVLVYLNDEDYNMEWGGNIVFEGKETIAPIYGNIAILDFKDNNCLHEVKKVVDGYGRYAILDFVSLGESEDTPNYY